MVHIEDIASAAECTVEKQKVVREESDDKTNKGSQSR